MLIMYDQTIVYTKWLHRLLGISLIPLGRCKPIEAILFVVIMITTGSLAVHLGPML